MDFVSGWCLDRFTLLSLVCTVLAGGVWDCEFVGRFFSCLLLIDLFWLLWFVCFGFGVVLFWCFRVGRVCFSIIWI